MPDLASKFRELGIGIAIGIGLLKLATPPYVFPEISAWIIRSNHFDADYDYDPDSYPDGLCQIYMRFP